jgi:signal transduction histidine kinase
VQIVLALAALMLLSFVPLFFAVASVTKRTLLDAREQGARALARAVAADIGEVWARGDRGELARVEASHVGHDALQAVCVWGPSGEREVCAGGEACIPSMAVPTRPYREGDRRVLGELERALEVTVPVGDAVVVARVRTDDDADRAAPLVRLVALYMITFALALLTFAYFALTRLIVRPLEALVHAANRVATGSRFLAVPHAAARELAELGASLGTMTDRRVLEADVLRAKVEELILTTSRLQEAQRQLVRSEQMASVGRLSAGLAHEIGNPLAALLGMEDLLLEGGISPEEQRDFLVRMKKETERINGVIRDLLDFARPEGGGATSIRVQAAPTDVASVVHDVFSLVKMQKPFKTVRLVVADGSEPANVALSAQRLTQVLLNVVLNAGAAIAAREGGARDADAVTVRVRRRERIARIEVEDTGPGVPASMRERVFEPFVTTKDVGQGTGLGLSVCRGVVEAAGGTIAFDASYEQGARVVIEIPLAKG